MDIASKLYGDTAARVTAVWVALSERDVPTQEHCDRVCGLALELGRKCALSERELGALRLAAGFHDVGKIGIPDVVLKKPDKLTDEDWAVMKTHAIRSERIVLAAGLEESADIARAVRNHHERYDGRGYPDGLSGESIPILARMVAVVDAYDAMSHVRHSGPSRTHSAIMDELFREQGRQHDPHLIGKFADVIEGSTFKAADNL